MIDANAIAKLGTFSKTDMKYTCQFCKKDFVKETSLAVHSCEPRKRRQEKEEAGVRLGFHAYIKFYEMTQGSAKLKTYDDFCDSPYYKAFVKFGRYCVSIKAINPARFTEYVLKQNKKTVGIRVPDNVICNTIINALGNPIITTSLHNMEDDILDYYTDPEVIHNQYQKLVDIVIDGGFGNLYASTVLDCSEEDIVVIREGLGSLNILD